MLNDDAKKIMYKKFDKDSNFENIQKNIKHEKIDKNYIKLFQCALVPSCAILILCILIFQENNDMSNLLLGKRNVSSTNTITNDNIIMDIETEIPNQNNIIENLENKTSLVVASKKEIYKTINNSREGSWAYDPTIPENILKDNKISKYVIKVKIMSVGEGEMLAKQENFYNPYTCFTPVKMQVIDNLSDNKLSGTIKAYIHGGEIKISNLLKSISNEEARNMGILSLSKEEQEKYIQYIWSNPYYEPVIGDEYVVIIGKTNESLYQVSCGGYGIFSVNKSNNQEKYINVITGKEWKI